MGRKQPLGLEQRMLTKSADCKFDHLQISRLQRMAGMRAAIAAFRPVGECLLWADRNVFDKRGWNGPFLPFTNQSRCRIRSPLTGHSLRVRNLEMAEFTVRGTKLPLPQ